jgi:chaperonin GroEL
MKERKDRYDDAVLAVACALEEGIIEGGGVALYKSILELYSGKYLEDTPEFQITESLTSPFRRIVANGAEIHTKKNMFENNIIDPLKVTRCALENAVSVAKTVLSTDCIVLNPSVWN